MVNGEVGGKRGPGGWRPDGQSARESDLTGQAEFCLRLLALSAFTVGKVFARKTFVHPGAQIQVAFLAHNFDVNFGAQLRRCLRRSVFSAHSFRVNFGAQFRL